MCISPRPPIHCNFPEQEFSSAEQQTDIWPDLLSFSNTFFSQYFVATVCCLLSFACLSSLFFLDKNSVQPLLHIAQQQCNLSLLSFSKTFAPQFYAIACFLISCHFYCPLNIVLCCRQHRTKTMQPDRPRLSFANAIFKGNNSLFQKSYLDSLLFTLIVVFGRQ